MSTLEALIPSFVLPVCVVVAGFTLVAAFTPERESPDLSACTVMENRIIHQGEQLTGWFCPDGTIHARATDD